MDSLPLPGPQVWGHRGAMACAPQNTLPSFLAAQDQGADGVELDVQLSQDGTLVVFHDAWVDGLTDGRGRVSDLSWTYLQTLDAGSHFGRSWRGTKIPALEQVFDVLSPGTTINIELKTQLSDPTWQQRWRTLVLGARPLGIALVDTARRQAEPAARALARLLKGTNPSRLVISSFDPFALEVLAAHLPAAPPGAEAPSVLMGRLDSPSWPWVVDSQTLSLVYQAWHPHHSQITPTVLTREKTAGRLVNVWTVNDPGHAVTLGKLGVNAIITDLPGEVLRALGR